MYCKMRAYHTEHYFAEVVVQGKKLSSKNFSSLEPIFQNTIKSKLFNSNACSWNMIIVSAYVNGISWILNPMKTECFWFINSLFAYLFVGVFVQLDNFSLIWRTSPLPVKSCKFWPMLGTNGHSGVRAL